jgi:NADH-quinone oxidoreductase subunit A
MAHFFAIDYANYSILLICIVIALAISGIVLGLSYLLAIQAPDTEKLSAYECGFEPFEDARNKFDVRFYIVAILFIIFDLEVAVLFPWAVSLGLSGAVGYFLALAFLFILTLGFIYEVAKGALNIQ